MRTPFRMLTATALSCVVVSHSAHAADVATQYLYTHGGGIIVPQGTVRIDLIVKGASGGKGKHGNAKGGRGGEIAVSYPYGHGYRSGDRLEVFVGHQDDHSISGVMAGGDFGRIQSAGGSGSYGGGGSGVYNWTQRHWLVIAGGGGGAGGDYEATSIDDGGDGGHAGHPGGSSRVFGEPVGSAGGAAGASCATSPGAPSWSFGLGGKGEDSRNSQGGGGGGGGGGCQGGGGGGVKASLAGGGGGGGGNYIHPGINVHQGLAPAGGGSINLTLTTYHEPPPLIASLDKAVFVVGQPACFDVIGVGRPPPDVHVSGNFPDGMTFRVPLFSGIGQIRGTPTSASVGTYPISITMRNDWGTASQTLTIEVVTPEHAPAGANVCSP